MAICSEFFPVRTGPRSLSFPNPSQTCQTTHRETPCLFLNVQSQTLDPLVKSEHSSRSLSFPAPSWARELSLKRTQEGWLVRKGGGTEGFPGGSSPWGSSILLLSSLAAEGSAGQSEQGGQQQEMVWEEESSTVVFRGARGAPWPGPGDLFKGHYGKNRAGLGGDGKQLLLARTWCQEGGWSSQAWTGNSDLN